MVKAKILDKVEDVIKAGFSVKKLLMDENLAWLTEVAVIKTLEKVYHNYNLKLIFNEQPFLDDMTAVEHEIRTLESDPQLFADMKKKEIDRLNARIKSIRNDMIDKKKKCPEIDFIGSVEELKYKDGKTIMKIGIPDDVIPDLHKNKAWFNYYRIELRPFEN